jgi:hypothetical protein
VWADNQTKVVNFESELATYTDWEFTDLTRTEGETIGSGNSAVTTNPHGGDYFVKTSLSSGSWAVTKRLFRDRMQESRLKAELQGRT